MVRYLKLVAAIGVFVFLGVMLGLAIQSRVPDSNWNEYVGGGCGFTLAVVFIIEGYIQRWYKGWAKAQRIGITWLVGGGVAWAIVSLSGKNEPGDNAGYNLLYAMLGSLAVRFSMALHSWAERT